MPNEMAHETTDEQTAGIRELVDEAQAYQLDVEPFIALHTPDAIIVNFVGRPVLGREVLQRAMEQALASPLAKVVTTTEIHDIRFVRPDVAIVSCTKHISDERDDRGADDRTHDLASRGSLTYVVVHEDGRWRIALAQTTPIQAL
jgi:uncharacterized protein (TIGR02246 family)